MYARGEKKAGIYALAAVFTLLVVSGCQPDEESAPVPDAAPAPAGDYVQVASIQELSTGQVRVVAAADFTGTFEVYPIAESTVAVEAEVSENARFVLVERDGGLLAGYWDDEDTYTGVTLAELVAVIDLNGNTLLVDPDGFSIIDVNDLIDPDDWAWGGAGCCVMCVTRPDGSQMCFSVCRGCG